MKFQKLLQLAVLASSFQAYQFAVAGDADFTLTNKTGYDLESVYVAPSKSKDWGNDHLGKSVLANSSSREIVFNKSAAICNYDMLIKWVGFGEADDRVWGNLDLCSINKITLIYNKNTDLTSAVFE